jgi:hypothetical protein
MIERVNAGEIPLVEIQETVIEIPEGKETTVELEDGSIEITIEEPEESSSILEAPFDSNLAEFLERDRLNSIGYDLIDLIKADEQSREDWLEGFRDGMKLLGFKPEDRTEPWAGACGIVSTMIPEAVVRFQSNAMTEIFPADGPVKVKIMGRVTKEVIEQSERVRDRMNYTLTEEMPDYRTETEKLLFGLAFIGSAFRKVCPDTQTGKPAATYVRAQDMIIPYGASSLQTAPRYTEVLRLFPSDVQRLQVTGQWLDVPVDDTPDVSDLQEAIDEATERTPSSMESDPGTYYECHTLLDIEEDPLRNEDGLPLPYVVTFDRNGVVVAIRRNWDEPDPRKQKLVWYAAYSYIPAEGPYGYGVLHLVGGSAKAATSIERQLIDAGTLANLPGGFKTKDARVAGSDDPVPPGEWRDVDLGANTLRESFFPLPYKEPSGTLLTLLNRIEENGRRLASISDIQVGDMSGNAPVGSVLAVMEREMKVMSAVQARLHASLRDEFRILARVMRDMAPDEYEYDVEGGSRLIRKADFDSRIDVIPVSDPNAATLSQRITLYQVAVQLAQQAPQLYDLAALHRQMLTIAGIKDVELIIPDKTDIKPTSVVAENMAIATGKPVKAFEWEPHEAHIASHTAFLQDPTTAAILGQNPQAQAIFAAAQAHIAEHFAYQYRANIERELGIPLPGLDQKLPGDIESQLAVAVAQASRQLLQKNQQAAAQQEAEAKAQDPVLQMQQMELQLKQAEIQRKAQADAAKAQLTVVTSQQRNQVELERIRSQERMAQEAAIDRNQQFLAETKVNAPMANIEIEKIKAQIAEILARIDQMM